jgi:hypothetical protein
MKELTTVSGNILFSENREGDKLNPGIEVVLVVSEVNYRAGIQGTEKTRSVETIRFFTGVEGLRGLASTLVELADAADATAARVTFAPETLI